jgi:hypothetical protein
MKKCLVCLVVVLGAVAAASADYIVDNFESYADSAALNAAWVKNTSSNITHETSESFWGGKCMVIRNNGDLGIGFAQTKYDIPGGGAIWGTKGINLTYLGFTGIQMKFAVPVNNTSVPPFGSFGGTGGRVFLSMFDCWGQKVFGASYSNAVSGSNPYTSSGTNYPNGAILDMPFSAGLVSGMNLDNVFQITVGYDLAYYSTGCLLIDDVILTGTGTSIPEPATMVILGLGGLLLRKRK